MSSFMNVLGRAFGTVGNAADMLSTGIGVLNDRMQAYSENNLRDMKERATVEFARTQKEVQKDMLEITKEMDTIAKDPLYKKSQQWFKALQAEMDGKGPASYNPYPFTVESSDNKNK